MSNKPKTNPQQQQPKDIIVKINEVTNIMHENIKIQLNNIAKTEDIEKQTEELMAESMQFNKKAKELKNKMWWKNIKARLIIGGSVLFILLFIILLVVGINGGFNKK